jgi:membrane associated rhomboid family serine protease
MKSKSIWKIIRWPALFVILLWLIEGASVFFKVRFVELGIFPRAIFGLPGIIFSPFIHANYEHLLSNTLPLLVVGIGLIYFYGEIAKRVVLMIWLFTGFWVWLAARSEFHIGASGLIYGLVCFLFLSGILRKDTRLLAVSLLVTFLYGSMVWGILPVDQSISWESHLFGSVAGFFCAIYFRNLGPQRQKPQWEIDEEFELQNESIPEQIDETNSPTNGIIINYDYKEKDDDQESKNSGN